MMDYDNDKKPMDQGEETTGVGMSFMEPKAKRTSKPWVLWGVLGIGFGSIAVLVVLGWLLFFGSHRSDADTTNNQTEVYEDRVMDGSGTRGGGGTGGGQGEK